MQIRPGRNSKNLGRKRYSKKGRAKQQRRGRARNTNQYQPLESRRLLAGNLQLASQVSPLLDASTSVGISELLAADGVGQRYRTVSADGRFVVFESASDDLVANDNNGRKDVFRYDRQLELVELVSVGFSGDAGNQVSENPVISADGSVVAFESSATNLLSTSTSGREVFVRDFSTGTTELVSIEQDGLDNSGGSSTFPIISADGSAVVFLSTNRDLANNDTDSTQDLFVRNLTTSTTTLASVDFDGQVDGTGGSANRTVIGGHSISSDGNVVTFLTDSTNLVDVATSRINLFARNISTATTTLVSANTSGTGVHANSGEARRNNISGDGNVVVFESNFSDLHPLDTNARFDIFAHNIDTGSTTLISVNTDLDGAGSTSSTNPDISTDGTTIVYQSGANDLVPSGQITTPSRQNIYAYTFDDATATTGTNTLVSVNSMGESGNLDSTIPVVSDDGNIVAYRSSANNLVGLEANNNTSLFATNRTDGTTVLLTVDSTGVRESNSSEPGSIGISGDGSAVAFESSSTDLVDGDYNIAQDVFVRSTTASSLPEVASRVLPTKASSTANRLSRFTTISDRKQSISSDGRYVVFESSADNLVPGDNNGSAFGGVSDVFRYDSWTDTVELVSVNIAGTGTGNAASSFAVISADGSKVVFESSATNLVDLPVSGTQIYLRDFNSGTTSLISINRNGDGIGGNSRFPRISADGSTVAFFSTANSLLDDTSISVSGNPLYARDLSTETTTLVSINATGDASANGNHSFAVISDDGSVIAYQSTSTNLSPLDTDTNTDIFARSLIDETTTLVSVNFSGDGSADRVSQDAAISGDGSTIVYTSSATNLVDPAEIVSDTGNDVYARNLLTGETTLVSLNILGNASANSSSQDADINFNGDVVVFESSGNNLIGGISGSHVYRRNLVSGSIDLVSIPVSGNATAWDPQVSEDGNIVTFVGTGAFLDQTSLNNEIFVRNMSGATTRLVSQALDGGGGNSSSSLPVISDDGLTFAFLSYDTNLVENDRNVTQDVFVVNSLFQPPVIEPQTFVTTEDDNGVVSFGTVIATGVESAITYQITGGDSGLFVIDSTTGELKVAGPALLDFESQSVHSIEVAVTDALGLADQATITIEISDVNEAPVIPVIGLADQTVNEDNTLTISAADLQTLLGGRLDQDAADPNSALNGTITIFNEDNLVLLSQTIDLVNFSDFNFTPPANFFGNLFGTIQVTDNVGLFDTSDFGITVNDINDIPVLLDDNTTTNEDTSVTINVLINDSDIDGTLDPTSVQAVAGPANGSVSIDAVTGAIIYTPDPNFHGIDTFTYTVQDDDIEIGTPATVSITVNDVNDAPVAIDDQDSTDEDTPIFLDILANDSDVDGSLVPGSIFHSAPANGTVSLDTATGQVTYTPDLNFSGIDSFAYAVFDDDGAISNIASVTITVGAVNDPPMAFDDVVSTPEDLATVIAVLSNDLDVDGSLVPASVTVVDGPMNGSANVDSLTGQITFTPDADFHGTDSFTYTVVDDDGAVSNLATVSLTVEPVNDAPIAIDDAFETLEDFPVNGNVLAPNPTTADSDIDGDTLSVAILFAPDNGSVSLASDGSFVYTPDENFNGVDSFEYRLFDGQGGVAQATATISVTAQNDAPVADDATFSIDEDDEIGTTVGFVTSSDVDGPAPEYSIINGNINNAFSIDSSSGEITVASNLDFETLPTYQLVVEVSDGQSSDTATINIDVDDVNEAPSVTLVNEILILDEDTDTSNRIRVADIVVTDDALGDNEFGLAGQDATLFEIDGNLADGYALYLMAGANLDFETNPQLDATVIVDDGQNPTDSDSITISIADVPEPGPAITGVRVNSTAWDDGFRDFVDGAFGDDIALGYPIPIGSGQLDILPWTNINQLLVTFNADVGDSLEAGDLSLNVQAGIRGDGTTADIPVIVESPFDWVWDAEAGEGVATFTLNQSIEPARIDLMIASGDVNDVAGNTLDGEWVDGQASSTSGDGVAGGDFHFRINVLPADVLLPSNEVVTTDDALEILQNPGLLLNGVPLNFDPRLDLNGDGRVNGLDSQAAVSRNTSRLPELPRTRSLDKFVPKSKREFESNRASDRSRSILREPQLLDQAFARLAGAESDDGLRLSDHEVFGWIDASTANDQPVRDNTTPKLDLDPSYKVNSRPTDRR